jgi:hypothetical protein
MTVKLHPEKTADLPPKGSRNPDPITDQPGSHPIETGIGAAVGGAATGMAVGSVAGPVGTAIGAAAGAVAGGLAGKGIGELIDPTTEDNWLRERFSSRPYAQDYTFDDFRDAYRYGALFESKRGDTGIDLADPQLQADWESRTDRNMPWGHAKAAIQDGYDRTVELRKERAAKGTCEPCE